MPPFIKTNIPLAPRTTLGIGGPADFFCVVETVDELRAATAWARRENIPITMLGSGSNVLVRDEGVRGLVLVMAIGGEAIISSDDTSVTVRVGAGVVLDEFIERCVMRAWWGLENLSAIPGTVGATPIQNVGAYGVDVAQVIEGVTVYDARRDMAYELDNASCQFAYRDSCFKHAPHNNLIITAVTFRLHVTPAPNVSYKDVARVFGTNLSPPQREIRAAITAIRADKFPDWHTHGTAGSFFKNPTISLAKYESLARAYPDLPGYPTQDKTTVKVSLGWILEHILGKKGYREGNVALYEKQALVLVNCGGATAREVYEFSEKIIAAVRDMVGIEIEREVRVV